MRRIKCHRRVYATAIGAVLAVVLAACGGSAGNGSAGAGALSSPQTEQQLVKTANSEGSVVFYNSFVEDQIPPLIAAFHKKYPKIKVASVIPGSEMVPRITTEQRGGKYSADVIAGSAQDFSALYSQGAIVKYNAPDAPSIPGFSLPSGYRDALYLKSTVIAWNPTALAKAGLQPPATWEDLTKPEWKGKFSIVANSSGLDFYLSLISSLGHAKALALVKRLGANKPILATSHTQATTAVQGGEPVATATAYSYLTAQFKKQNPKTMDFAGTHPLLTTVDTVTLAKNAPHPAAAKLFIDWLMSHQGQNTIVTATGHAAMGATKENDPTVWDPGKLKPVFAQPDVTVAQYNQYTTEYEKALGFNG